MERIAVVTGAYRGLGLETCRELAKREYRVILTARKESEGKAAAQELANLPGKVEFFPLDVTSDKSADDLLAYLNKLGGLAHVLVNNAGIYLKSSGSNSIFTASLDEIRQVVETNTYSAIRLCQRVIPLMKKHNYGRVVNVSSGMGQLSEMGGGYAAYRISKTAMNAVTKIFASETQGTNILVNAVCPGWVRTEMGGKEATRSVPEGTAGIVWAATLPEHGPTGGFFRDGKAIEW